MRHAVSYPLQEVALGPDREKVATHAGLEKVGLCVKVETSS